MTMHRKQFLSLATAFISVASYQCFAQIQASSATMVAPLAASAPTAVPALIPYSGVAVDTEGHALSGEKGMTFLIYKEQNGGEPLFAETQSVVSDTTGHYTVRLGASMSSGIPLDLFSSGEARWLEVQVAGEKPQSRALLVSVPYALKAADAATLGGLPASAFALAGTPSFAANATSAVISPNAVSNVTTIGGTANKVAKFSGGNTIVNSIIFDNGTNVGINTTAPTATLTVGGTLTVNGGTTQNGDLLLAPLGTATASAGDLSHALKLNASVYNSSTHAVVSPRFQLQTEVFGNNTAAPGGRLDVLASSGSAGIAETGLYINTDGTIHFSPGQTFPGGTGGGGAPFCVATGGGFGSGGTTFIAPSLVVPAVNNCSPWAGYTKTASTVILTTNGTACLSSTGKTMTVSVSSIDPDFLGTTPAVDYIQLTRASSSGTFTGGSDQGQFSGSANQVTCTSSLLTLPDSHD